MENLVVQIVPVAQQDYKTMAGVLAGLSRLLQSGFIQHCYANHLATFF